MALPSDLVYAGTSGWGVRALLNPAYPSCYGNQAHGVNRGRKPSSRSNRYLVPRWEFALNIVDIAALCGLSKSTVSRYLNGGSVSASAAAKIAEAIEQTGFQANLSASRLKTNRSNLIGVMMDGFLSPSVSKSLASMSAECHRQGYQPFIMIDEVNEDNKVANLRALIQQGVDAVVLGTHRITHELHAAIDKAGVPVLHTGQRDEDFTWRMVNERRGGELLGTHVAQQQPHRLAFLAMRNDDEAAGIERCEAVLAQLDPSVTECHVFHVENYELTPREQIERALSLEPDFIVCASDRFCIELFRVLDERGLSVPRDIRVASFGNHPFGALPGISLTTVAYDYEELGRDIAATAIAMARGEEVAFGSCDFPVELIVRNSSVRP